MSDLDDKNTNETSETQKQGKKKRRKKPKPSVNRRGRVIVRNLPFKTTEETLKEHFEKFGEVEEVNVLKRPDGKLVGCGFIQFKVVQNAAKAIYHLNGKPFLGRTIVCDWAVAKNSYVQNVLAAQETIKEEDGEEKEPSDVKIKEEVVSDDEDTKVNLDVSTDLDESGIKVESNSEDEDGSAEESSESEDDSGSEEEKVGEESENEDDEVDEEDEKKVNVVEKPNVKSKYMSHDINEGKTIFIKNIPFQATNDDLKECMRQFGPVYYALICIDPVTEHSRGTGFVKFVNVEDAEKCLSAGTELMLMGNILDCHKALDKKDLDNKSSKKPEKKDSRNLYLIKEGVILAGSKSAEGVSAADMAKRLELEKWKTQILRNLNMFISKYRLIVHNLPENVDDSQLRQLFVRFTGPKTVIKECRIMRDLKNVDDKGKGVSKGYGFATFEKHEDALKALRAINNNPNVFKPNKRPIVAFSIENKAIMNARTKRLEKSRMNNPNYKKKELKTAKTETGDVTEDSQKLADGQFVGLSSKPGIPKMRSRYKLKTQAQMHMKHLKEAKKRKKQERKTFQQKKQEFIRQPGQKQKGVKRKRDDSNFTQLVNKYKTKLMDQTVQKKSKWYD